MDQGLSNYYRLRASEYNEVYEKPERQRDITTLAETIRDFATSRQILEVAAGTGFWTVPASEAAASILATDLAEETLAIARERAYACPVEFARCDAFSLNEVAGSFDAGLACFWLSHLSRSEMTRFGLHLRDRLDPGSQVLFADNRYVAGSNWPITRMDGDRNTYQRRTLRSGEAFEVLKNFPDASELRALGEMLGHEVVLIELTYYWVLTFRTAE